MDDYEKLDKIGSGSYGIVNKCRHKTTGEIVAIKRFLESDANPQIKKIADREVKLLKRLKHGNLVNLKMVFKRKRKLHMVFEFIDHSLLQELENHPKGLPTELVQKVTWQCLAGIEFCHLNQVVHRDVKPENILVSKRGLVKLCDFGFARRLDSQPGGYTDYVATRWYRAPELLVGDTNYGSKVDVWAIGCLFGEMLTGRPVWPGKSDVDQLWRIICTLGETTKRLEKIFNSNPFFERCKIPSCDPSQIKSIASRYERFGSEAVSLMNLALQHDCNERANCTQMRLHNYFDGFRDWFDEELKALLDEPPVFVDPPVQQRHLRGGARMPSLKDHTKQGRNVGRQSDMVTRMMNKPATDTRRAAKGLKSQLSSRLVSQKDSSLSRRTKLNFVGHSQSQHTQHHKGPKRANLSTMKVQVFKNEEKTKEFHLPSIGKG